MSNLPVATGTQTFLPKTEVGNIETYPQQVLVTPFMDPRVYVVFLHGQAVKQGVIIERKCNGMT